MSEIRHRQGSSGTFARPRVAVVEDHPAIRQAVCDVLQSSAGVELLPPCDDLASARDLLAEHCPDLLLVDLGLPAGSGVTLIRMARAYWGARCTSALFSVLGIECKLMNAIEAGAKGIVFKDDPPSNWVHGVHLLTHGQSPLHSSMARAMLQRLPGDNLPASQLALLHLIAAGYTTAEVAQRMQLSEDEVGQRVREIHDAFQKPAPELSRRELELMGWLNLGYPFKKCAELMGVSESTTKTQAARAYEKLGASNLQSALYEARQYGFIA